MHPSSVGGLWEVPVGGGWREEGVSWGPCQGLYLPRAFTSQRQQHGSTCP